MSKNRFKAWIIWFLWIIMALSLSHCQQDTLPPPTATPTMSAATLSPAVTPTISPLAATATFPIPATTSPPATIPPPKAPNTAVSPPSPTPAATTTPFPTPEADLPTPPTMIPTAVSPLPKPDHITNLVLLGNDVDWAQGGRTDSIIIVSINKETKTATMITIPRDLYVYIPGWTMNRINLALPHGHGINYTGSSGGGGGLIKDTILYNFGISIDYYARIGFNGFKQIVDRLGDVTVVVNCPLRDWRLTAPDLDPTVEENWAQFELKPGVHQMDGDLALWYVRSRRTTNDFERGRRQQQVLQALLNQSLDIGILTEIPALWETYQASVETDIPLSLMLELAALAPEIRANGIHHLYLAGDAVRAWQVPTTREAVQLLQPDAAQPILERVMKPPVLNRAAQAPITVEVVTSDYILYQQLAENLTWYGFIPIYGRSETLDPPQTQIDYHAPNFKGSHNDLLSWIMGQEPETINLIPDSDSPYTYQVRPGRHYNPCLPQLYMPLETAE